MAHQHCLCHYIPKLFSKELYFFSNNKIETVKNRKVQMFFVYKLRMNFQKGVVWRLTKKKKKRAGDNGESKCLENIRGENL